MRRFRRGASPAGEVALNVIPLIDVVFFLLVFYVMASTFLREETVTVERPSSSAATAAEPDFVAVAITREGAIHCGGPVRLEALPAAMRGELARAGAGRCVVIADGAVPVATVLAVMDACRAGGATTVEVAAGAKP